MSLAHTFHQAVRTLRRAPGLGVAAVLCIGLGAAATTTVATLVSAVLLRPLPFPAADRLVRVWFDDPRVNSRISLSIPDVDDFAGIDAFDAFVATARVRVTAQLGDGTERMRGEGVSRGYFDVLGIRAAVGRLLTQTDHRPDAPAVMVLSHGTWVRHYGAEPGVIGHTVRTEGALYTIVGVAQPQFDGTVEDDVVEFFVPIEQYEPRALMTRRTARPVWAIGRLRPGSSIDAAQHAAGAVGKRLAATYPDIYRQWQVRVEPLGENWRERLRSGGAILFAAAAMLLMIAAVNVGSLLLARVVDRRRELAIRAAIGAGRGTIAAQLFAEALLIVLAGGALGVLAGPWLLHGFLAIAPLGRLTLPRYLVLEADALTVTLTVGALLAAGLFAGTLPALLGRRAAPGDVLHEDGRGVVGHASMRRWSAWLVAAETALTLVLLVAGGLLLRSYERLSTIDLGFERDRIARLAVTISRTDAGDPARLPAVYDRLREELRAVPGVTRIGLVSPTLPPWEGDRTVVRLEGSEVSAPDGALRVGAHRADEGLLPLLGARIVSGRNIQSGDSPSTAPVAVISRSLSQLFGGPEQAVGRTLTLLGDDPSEPRGSVRVVGVADDIAYDGFIDEDTRRFVRADAGADVRTSRRDIYLPLTQFPETVISIGAYTEGEPAAVIEPLRKAIAAVAPTSATHWISTMRDEVALEYEPTRFYTMLVLAFSASALALTSAGVFALLSHAAARRSGEIGLRLALGATRAAAARELLKGALLPLGAGVVLGGATALSIGRLMSGVLFGVGAFDGVAFASAVGVLIAMALAASALPARRAASVEPGVVLRSR
jgi:predicted permease